MISLVSKSKAQKRDPEHVLRYSIDDNSRSMRVNTDGFYTSDFHILVSF